MTKFYVAGLGLLLFFLTSCGSPGNVNKHKEKTEKHGASDTLWVTRKAAVSFWVDTAEINKRNKQGGEDAEVGNDDYVFYAAQSDSILSAHKVHVIDADKYKYIRFVNSDGKSILIKKDTSAAIFNMYFFDPSGRLFIADISDMESEYQKFFR